MADTNKQEDSVKPQVEKSPVDKTQASNRAGEGTSNATKPTPDIRKVKKSNTRGAIISSLLVAALLFAGYWYVRNNQKSAEEVNLNDVVREIEENNVEDVVIRQDGKVYVEIKERSDSKYEGTIYAYLPENMDFVTVLQQEDIKLSDDKFDLSAKPITQVNWVDILSVIFMALLAFGVFMFVRNMQSSGGKLLDFGQSKARLIWGKKSDVGFKDVAGIKESKDELIEIVQFLKSPKKFTRLGARIPKGVLLVGPPGSGKTLLARAVAGEANVPFFHTSGSEFEEMLVGAGASRVRDLFKKARRAAPCIIFIDEIDAVAKKRGTTLHSGNTEQTLNQILVEMDGLEPRTNVIIMAATNRPDVLDPAILRPGRFDRHIALTLPDVNEREQILKIHAKNKKLDADVDLRKIARRTVGFSGADLENTLNEAAILAAKQDRKAVTTADLDESALKVRYGPEKRSKKREEEDIKMTAFHEAGHAIVARYTPDADPVDGVSIISRGMAGGMTMLLPEKDREHTTRNQMLASIAMLSGGRVAEEIMFGDLSTGASKDIEAATDIARDMVKRYGMSEKMGFVQYGDHEDTQYLGYGYEKRDYSEETARDIDLEVQKVVSSSLENARKILTEHRDELEGLAEYLLKKEVIDAKEFKEFFEGFKSKSEK